LLQLKAEQGVIQFYFRKKDLPASTKIFAGFCFF